jgi:GT2 family glycosyltransferase
LPKRVAIILLNWNGLEDTIECIASLSNLKYQDYQIIVIDNHSDEDLTVLRVLNPSVILIKNQENYGFAKGNNIGIHKAAELGFEYCWILNNDTTVAPDALTKLVSAIERDKKLAAVTNQIRYYNYPSSIWFGGGIFKNGLPMSLSFSHRITEQNASSTTEFLAGTSFLARIDVLDEIGGFDEKFFCYVEDVDLSVRIQSIGYHIDYVPEALYWDALTNQVILQA